MVYKGSEQRGCKTTASDAPLSPAEIQQLYKLVILRPKAAATAPTDYPRSSQAKQTIPKVNAQNNMTGSHHGVARNSKPRGIGSTGRCLGGMVAPLMSPP